MHDGPRQCDVVIGNVSRGGLMAKCDRPPAKGARVEIHHGGLCIAGRVIWSKNRRFGLQSEEPIDLAALFPPEPASARRGVRRFTPPQIKPALRANAGVRKRRSPAFEKGTLRTPLVAVLVATTATLVVELGLVDFAAVWTMLRQFISG